MFRALFSLIRSI